MASVVTHRPEKIILFDGVCNLCNSSVQFVIKRDKKRQFRYAALQSDFAKNLLSALNQPASNLDSVIFVDGNSVYYHADAALKVAAHLGSFWPLARIFWVVPRGIRNAVYNYIGRNRYAWFGKQESCMMPTKELRELFLG